MYQFIAGKRSSTVLVSEEDWKAIQETMVFKEEKTVRVLRMWTHHDE